MKSMMLQKRLKAAGLSIGLFVSYSGLAVIKEQIFKNNYGDEKFVYPITLTGIQFIMNVVIAKGMMMSSNHCENETPQKYYVIVSIFNLLAMLMSNMSLQYVPYVVMVVGKACKPITVIICTAIIARKVYTIQRYIFVSMIAFGVGLFVYKDGITVPNELLLGNILISLSLLLEGFLGGAQAKMRMSYKPSSINYMYYVNLWCAVFTFPLIFIEFEGLKFIQFCLRHQEAIWYIFAAIVTGCVGHYFNSAMISNFGPLPTVLVSTTRKFFTILFSTVIFGNALNWMQWTATIIIFEAITLDIFFGRKSDVDNKEEVREAADEIKREKSLEITTKKSGFGDDR